MKIITLLAALFISVSGLCQQLFLSGFTSEEQSEALFSSESVSIHHLGTDFFIATALQEIPTGAIVLKQNPWNSGSSYFLVWLPEVNTQDALTQLKDRYGILYSDNRKAIIEVTSVAQQGPTPFVHGGLVRISPASAWKTKAVNDSRYVIDTFPAIYELMAMVDTGEFMATIRHLESYGTRYYASSQAIEAQNWIKAKFEQYPGLEVELQDFPYSGGSSDNVIAILPGKTSPDEYIVVGSHYDSFAWGATAPGADDNASGTAAVLELARILSQFEFDKSIVFCTFSAEEIGLVGSEFYASQAQLQGMNILGYFNFDMIGYRNGNDPIHTDMIAPTSAAELVNFYKGVVAIYLPDFDVFDAQLSGGDSDHTSFNNNGYMGIFPFEDVPNYSPYIHTGQDLVGPSVNSPEMAETFIQANLASVVSLSVPFDPVGIHDQLLGKGTFSMFPNPATSDLTFVSLVKEPVNLRILSSMGQKVLERTLTGHLVIDVTGMAPGIYFVLASSSSGTVIERLIVAPSR